jgi:hypothetical protein
MGGRINSPVLCTALCNLLDTTDLPIIVKEVIIVKSALVLDIAEEKSGTSTK